MAVARTLICQLAAAPAAVIENVPAAPVRPDVRLTGPVVGLPTLYRLRHFEAIGWRVPDPPAPTRPAGSVAAGTLVTVTTQGGIPDRGVRRRRAELRPDLPSSRHHRADMRDAMGLPADCPWTMRQIGEAVPPAYARWIGERAIRWIEAQRRG